MIPFTTIIISISLLISHTVHQQQININNQGDKTTKELNVYEGFTAEEVETAEHDVSQPQIAKKHTNSQISIIIDDMGYKPQVDKEFIKLDLPIACAFIPEAPFSKEMAELAWQQDKPVLVHLPMEPEDSKYNPGKDALFLHDSPEEITRLTRKNIANVPHAVGVNNHMGSKFTSNRITSRIMLQEVKRHNLFFIDSHTSSNTVAWQVANELGIANGLNTVFLDNVKNKKAICRQIKKLIEQGKRQGRAIGIGHSSKAMLEALTLCRPQLRNNIELIRAENIVSIKE